MSPIMANILSTVSNLTFMYIFLNLVLINLTRVPKKKPSNDTPGTVMYKPILTNT